MSTRFKEIVTSFETGTLPKGEWCHEMHLKIMLWYCVTETDVWSAANRFKVANITRRRNIYTLEQVLDSYHETITMFWAKEVWRFYQQHKQEFNFDEIFSLLLKTPKFLDRDYICNFYNQEILNSMESKTVYLQPTTRG